MKIFMRSSATFLLLIVAYSSFSYFFRHTLPGVRDISSVVKNNIGDNKAISNRLHEKAGIIKEFAKANNYNTTYCFMADMHISSGSKRFFVYNMQKDSVELSGLVAHGSGSGKGENNLYFSNTISSNCTSLGKYKVGVSYYGKFGLAYKLHGLDKTNDKAFDRFVVLHAHECIPDAEVSPRNICESWGCPTVSPAFLNGLKNYIARSQKPVLLWIYY